MLISCNKLKKHIKNADIINFLDIWDKFSIRTAEVEEVIIKGSKEDLKDVVVAKIIEHKVHPKKDQYHLLKVSDGKKEYDVLCGAPNCKLGMKVAYVKPGGRVSGFDISEKEIAGFKSQGMCCSVNELGIGDNHDGILELPADAPLGVDITEYYPEIKDIIVEIDNKSLTNRPDLWGHYGIAREIAAITGNELLPLDIEKITNDKKDIKIKIEDKNLCSRFSALKVNNVTKKESPIEMQIFLHYTGVRSINLLVDISNYIMLELGQPNHAYDANKVTEINVGLAKDNDTFVTLDNIERNLTSDTLMIKNNEEYIGIAGIMGGLKSEVEDNTTSVLIEAASFDSTNIRKTATNLGLRTEASTRFEKSLDPNMTKLAIKRFVKLLRDIDKDIKIASNLTDNYPNELKEKEIILHKEKLNRYLSFEIKDETIKNILESLGFKSKSNKSDYKITVPTFRATKDIEIEEDIIEEITRMYGFENIEIKPLKLELTFTELENIIDNEYTLKRLLATKYNLSEVHTYLWYKTHFLNELNISKENISLVDKSTDNILRDDLNLTLLEVAKENLKHINSVSIFEIGTVIKNNENKRMLSILIADEQSKTASNYQILKNIAVNIFKTFKNIEINFEKSKSEKYYNKDLTYNIVHNKNVLGQIKVFENNIGNIISKKKSFVVLEIDFDQYMSLEKKLKLFKTISKYPAVTLDYTIITSNDKKYYELDKILKEFRSEIIQTYELIDTYETKDEKRYTIRYVVSAMDKTLNQKDLTDFKDSFINHIKNNKLTIVE